MGALIADGKGNTGDLSYFQIYPHQETLTLVISVFVRVFRSGGLDAFQVFCLVCADLCLYWGAMIALRLSGQEKAGTMTLLFLLEFVSIFLYAKYVYGTLPSLCFSLGAFYFIVCWVQEHRLSHLLAGLAFTALMYIFYTGTLIAMIAIVVILVLDAIQQNRTEKKSKLLSLTGSAIALIIVLTILVSSGKIFTYKTELADNSGMPATAWILMGITSQSDYGAGGYDGSSVQLYQSCGENTALTTAVTQGAIKEAIREYLDGRRPLYFFVDKTIAQWNDPWFNSLTMTINSVDKVQVLSSTFTPAVLERIDKALLALMNLGYLMSALYMALQIRKREVKLETLLLPLYFIGGFVFQLFWETKGRYCFPYYVCLLILAGIATAPLEQLLVRRFGTMRGKGKREEKDSVQSSE